VTPLGEEDVHRLDSPVPIDKRLILKHWEIEPMLAISQDDVPMSPSEQNISLIILGILLLVAALAAFLGPYLSAAWQDLKKELKNGKR